MNCEPCAYDTISRALMGHRGLIDDDGLALRPAVRQVVAELAPVFDAGDIAAWFAAPNAWLGGLAPLAQVRNDAAHVLDAARADRFALAG